MGPLEFSIVFCWATVIGVIIVAVIALIRRANRKGKEIK
jgi:hypothetical protein